MLAFVCVLLSSPIAVQEAAAQKAPAAAAERSAAPVPFVAPGEWLAANQSVDGAWRHEDGSDSFTVGLTGLSLLALLGEGHTHRAGPHAANVAHAAGWLMRSQDKELGRFGELDGVSVHYEHAIATLALTELYLLSGDETFAPGAQKALDYIARARNPYAAWRYDFPPTGENDTSVTGWMLLALLSGRDAELDVDDQAIEGALHWFREVTDPETGRVGYDAVGSASSRIPDANNHFPTESGEAMTAVALLGELLSGQNPEERPAIADQADLLLRKLPEWDPEGLGNDLYYWYFGSLAMYQLGGKHWTAWQEALKKTLVEATRGDGDEAGSWEPKSAWATTGGRVYTTALMAMTGQVYFRYERVLGQR